MLLLTYRYQIGMNKEKLGENFMVTLNRTNVIILRCNQQPNFGSRDRQFCYRCIAKNPFAEKKPNFPVITRRQMVVFLNFICMLIDF